MLEFLKYFNIYCSKLHESNLFEHFLCYRLFCIIYSVLFIIYYLLLVTCYLLFYCLMFDLKLLIYHLLSLISIYTFPHFKFYSETGGSRQMGPTQTQTNTQAHTQSGSCISQRRPLGGFTQGKATDRIVLSITEKYENLLI